MKNNSSNNSTTDDILEQLAKKGITRGEGGLYRESMGSQHLLCQKFTVLGVAKSSNGMILGIACRKKIDKGESRQVILPFEAMRDMTKLAGYLQSLGLNVPIETIDLKAIATYVHSLSQEKTVTVFECEGVQWLTGGEEREAVAVIGNRCIARSEVNAIVALRGKSIYAANGTLDEWRLGVTPVLRNNPVLIVAVAAALSAPLKHLFNFLLLSLGLVGPSACGKTTVGVFINSFFGPAREPHGWSGTANAIEALALRHNDAPLVLDEMAEGKAADVLDLTYRLSNGIQKARAKNDGSLQDIAEIRTVIISTSEVTMAEHARIGRQARRQGHEARMPTIVLDEKFGCFSSLNEFPNSEALAIAISKLSRECYGVVWPEYMEGLILKRAKCKEFIEQRREEFGRRIATNEHHTALSAVERRVLTGFTGWALAGEMAIRLKILPLQPNEVVSAAQYVYGKWLARWRSGEGAPDQAILEHFRDFFQRSATGMFVRLCDWNDHNRINLAGYEINSKRNGRLYLVHCGYFQNELCGNFGVEEALAALEAAGFLAAHAGGRTWLQRMPSRYGLKNPDRMRFYAIRHEILFEQ